MEVVERAEGPFSRRNVQEWSRLDQLTGLLEHARVETDHWTASTSNSSHHFGKVVDSRSRSLAGGGQEQRQQTKQLEVFQASVPGGSVQVIRSSTSSTRQTHKVLSGGSGWIASDRLAIPSSENQGFDHLKLTLNPLDLSSQKTRASVGRSGSIGSRRPPSRPRSITSTKNEDVPEQVDGRQLTELSKKFHQEPQQDSILVRDSPILNGFSSDHNDNISNDKAKESQRYETTSSLINSLSSNVSNCKPTILKSHHLSLIRKKSCSSEDLHVVDEEGNDTDSNTSEWKRSSKVRRSLQFPPKPSQVQKETIVIPVTKSVSEIKKEIENRKQLVTSSFRTNQWEHFSELEGVLGAVKNGIREDDLSKDSSNSSDAGTISSSKTKKRQTFITVESLKEVKGRLRKLNSPDDEVLKNDDVDDGIVTEVRSSSPTVEVIDDTPKSSVKSYVFGMEVMLRKSKPAFIGTGSLESRTTNKSLTNGNNRSEEWYNRRKSYGFEQVGNQQNNDYSSFEKSKIESSTDSGICRSSDTFSSWQKLEKSTTNQSGPIKTSHSIVIKPYLTSKNNSSEVEVDAVVQKGRKTVVNLTSNTSNPSWTWRTENSDPNHSEMHKENLPGGKIADVIKSLREKSTSGNQRLSDPITISIPIQQTTKSNLTDSTSLLLKQSTPLGAVETSNTSLPNELTPYSELLYGKDTAETSTHENKSYFENIPWRGSRTKALSNFFDSEFKRHSIAVDQTKYLTHKKTYGSYCFDENNESDDKERKCEFQRNSLDIFNHNDKEINKGGESDHEMNCNEKKQKKVEFCKTEVHFAAEPGRFNIVETDGKPPPSNMFRRRRKTTSDAPNRNGLPEIRFGDTQYEKNMLSINEKVSPSQNLTAFRSSPLMYNNDENDSIPSTYSTIETKPTTTATTLENEFSKQIQEEQTYSEDDTPKPRSILKNNIPKPKSYLLGECPDVLIGEESKSWGVKLKSVKVEDESPKWDQDPQSPKETEFQKLLKSLRPATNKPPDLFELPSQMKQSSTATDNGLEVRITSSTFPPDLRRASWSVADRIKSVEEAKGYSTKVNFGPQETTVVKLDDLSSCLTPSQGLKSSWLIKEQNSTFDMDSRTSPRVGSTAHPPLNHRQGADAVNSTSGPPRVTSVALLHPDTDTKLPATARPLPRFADNHPSPTSSSYTSKNLLNSSGISSKVELSTNGERTWSFSKGLEDDSTVTTNKINESDFLGLPSEQSNHKITSLVLRDNSSPSKFSKNSQSPSKEALFLERSAERNILYNDENNRQMSSSPTSGTSRKVTSSVNIKLEAYQNNLGKTEPNYLVRPFNNRMVKEVNQNHPINVSTHKLEEKVEFSKKIEMKNPSNDVKSKERKLSSSSSGRDGWLNTPKEVQVRRKVEHIVRPQSSKKESKVSERTKKANSLKPIHKRTESPIYQNREIYTERQDSNDNTETESTILEELTKAADQILLAVNGYTDDDSFRASSEDECRKKRENFSNQPLCTISEVPNKKNNITKNSSRQSMGVIKSTRSNDLRREFRTSSKGKSGITSSNSSMESVPIPDVRPILSSEDRNKRRAARLLQRASSRELLFQSAASSSEDIGSGSDTSSLRTKRVFRRPRVHNGKQSTSATANESRTSERVQRTTASTEAHKNLRTKVQTENRCSRHSKTTSGSASGVRRERRPAVVTHGSRTQKKTPETSQSVRKSGTVSQAK